MNDSNQKKDFWEDENLVKILNKGGIVVMPTDTVYGIVTSALNKFSVLNLYQIRKKPPYKPLNILIGDILDIEKFSVTYTEIQKNILVEYWPGPVSIIFDCALDEFAYLHQGTNTITFRLPKDIELRNLLKKVGPLVAPSANLAGFPISKNIDEAKEYFGDKVDLYIDGGDIEGKASKIIKLQKDGTISILRE